MDSLDSLANADSTLAVPDASFPLENVPPHTHNGIDSPLIDKDTNGQNFVKLKKASSGDYSSQEYDNGNITSTATINWNNGNVQYATMTGNVTLTFTNPLSGMRCILHLAGAFTPTFPASVRWSGGSTAAATAAAGKKDIYTLIYSSKESLYDILQSPNYAIT